MFSSFQPFRICCPKKSSNKQTMTWYNKEIMLGYRTDIFIHLKIKCFVFQCLINFRNIHEIIKQQSDAYRMVWKQIYIGNILWILTCSDMVCKIIFFRPFINQSLYDVCFTRQVCFKWCRKSCKFCNYVMAEKEPVLQL